MKLTLKCTLLLVNFLLSFLQNFRLVRQFTPRCLVVLIRQKFLKLLQFVVLDRLLDRHEKPPVVEQIVDQQQHRPEKLVGLQKVVRVSSRVVPASDALTGVQERREIITEPVVGQVKLRECCVGLVQVEVEDQRAVFVRDDFSERRIEDVNAEADKVKQDCRVVRAGHDFEFVAWQEVQRVVDDFLQR